MSALGKSPLVVTSKYIQRGLCDEVMISSEVYAAFALVGDSTVVRRRLRPLLPGDQTNLKPYG